MSKQLVRKKIIMSVFMIILMFCIIACGRVEEMERQEVDSTSIDSSYIYESSIDTAANADNNAEESFAVANDNDPFILYNEEGFTLYIGFDKEDPTSIDAYGRNESGNDYYFFLSGEYGYDYMLMSANCEIDSSDKEFFWDIGTSWRTDDTIEYQDDMHIHIQLYDEDTETLIFSESFIYTLEEITHHQKDVSERITITAPQNDVLLFDLLNEEIRDENITVTDFVIHSRDLTNDTYKAYARITYQDEENEYQEKYRFVYNMHDEWTLRKIEESDEHAWLVLPLNDTAKDDNSIAPVTDPTKGQRPDEELMIADFIDNENKQKERIVSFCISSDYVVENQYKALVEICYEENGDEITEFYSYEYEIGEVWSLKALTKVK